MGAVVIAYTVLGGSKAVSQTQKQQMVVILGGMAAAGVALVLGLPEGFGFSDALRTAGAVGRMEVIDTELDPNNRYTVWSGLFGGFFLAMAYFGTDQSQVQRYLGAKSLSQSRLGLLFNGVFKVPMQFGILLVGVLLFAHHVHAPQPMWFNEPALARATAAEPEAVATLQGEWDAAWAARRDAADALDAARAAEDGGAEETARTALLGAQAQMDQTREGFRELLAEVDPEAAQHDADHVFITYVMTSLPIGLVGLLLAVILSAAMSSTASELSALGATSTMDLYRRARPRASEASLFRASKLLTVVWGGVALLFATVASLLENLIEAVNILGSIFYGTMLGIFSVAFFAKHVGGVAVFWAACVAQSLVIYLYFGTDLGFLWYNVIGTATVFGVSLGLTRIGRRSAE
jgi:Na+/proline symporter